MTRSLRSVLALAVTCCLAFMGAISGAFERACDVTISAARLVCDVVVDFALKTFTGPAQMVEQAELTERKHLTAAQRFLERAW